MNKKIQRRIQRHKKIRRIISGDSKRPRLSVFRSNRFIYVQLIDDSLKKTIFSVSEKEIEKKGTKCEKAFEVGQLVAQKAAVKKIKKVLFDRGGYAYHGRVKHFAEGAKKGGLIF